MRSRDIANEQDNQPKVWIYIDYQHDKTEKYRSAKISIQFQCLQHTSQTIEWLDYAANGIVANNLLGGFDSVAVVPDTVSEDWEKSACPSGTVTGN